MENETKEDNVLERNQDDAEIINLIVLNPKRLSSEDMLAILKNSDENEELNEKYIDTNSDIENTNVYRKKK